MASQPRTGRAAWVVEVLAVAALYAMAGRLGQIAAIPPGNVTPIWPSSGIALAAILQLGPRVWPGVWLGSFAVNTWVFLQSTGGSLVAELLTAAGMATGATLGALLGAHLLPDGAGAFASARGAVRFVALSGALSGMLSPLVGTTSLCLGGFDAWANYGTTWVTWWLGDVAGIVVVAPWLLSLSPQRDSSERRAGAVEVAAFGVLFLAVTGIGFWGSYPLGFAVIPLLVWAAFRLDHRGSTTAILAISTIAVAAAVRGVGPFVGSGLARNESLLLLQAFIAVIALTTLVLAAVVAEREQATAELRRYRDQLEQRVAERTRQLEAANSELEAFTSAVSHDLRNPLTIIDGSAQMLELSAERLDETGRESLTRLLTASRRMGELIRALLDLSRLEQSEPQQALVDLTRMARDVVAGLAARDPGRQVQFQVHDGLVALGDERLLRIVLDNLLDNAWKFTGPRVPARIEVGQAEGEGHTAYFVRDNGVGFDSARASEVFATFRRLHKEFPGMGIGLTTVQRIVRRHGGRVWAEGATGEGATFYFSLGAAGPGAGLAASREPMA